MRATFWTILGWTVFHIATLFHLQQIRRGGRLPSEYNLFHPVMKSCSVITRSNIATLDKTVLRRDCYVACIDEKFEALARHRMVTFTSKKHRPSPWEIMYAETRQQAMVIAVKFSLPDIFRVQCAKDLYYPINSYALDKLRQKYKWWYLSSIWSSVIFFPYEICSLGAIGENLSLV